MQLAFLLTLTCACGVLGDQDRGASGVTPIQKVIQMLNEMLVKGKAEKEDEEVRFSAFHRFCEMTIEDKGKSIKEADFTIEQLTADIAKAEADAEALQQELDGLDASMNGWEADEKAAKADREQGHADFKAVHTDYSESLDALERAINAMRKREDDVAQAPAQAALLDLGKVAAASQHFPVHVKQLLASYLQSGSGVESMAPPEANAYEFQSSGIVAMLEKLKNKFWEERSAVEKEELNNKQSHEIMMEEVHNNIVAAKDQHAEKTMFRARLMEGAANNKRDLSATETMRADDIKYRDDLAILCRQKAEDYEKRQALRQGEAEAIQKAIEIISSPSVTGNAAKHLPAALLQGKHAGKKTSLAQLRSLVHSPQQAKAASFLSDRASKSNSQLLNMMVQHLNNDPFTKVKKMIKDLLVKLMEQANEEADHKGWCDEELATNQATREELTANVEDLSAQIDQLTSTVAKLSERISDLQNQIAELDAAVLKATAERQTEKEKNVETIADAKEGQSAVGQAIQVLQEFYSKASGATALVQRAHRGPAEDVPETFDEPFKGNQAASGGILGMLEVVQSDFARLESETTSSEGTAQREFESFLADSAEDKKVKDTERFHKELERSKNEFNLNEATKDLASTHEQLSAAMDYYDKLKPSCIDTGLSYEDRVARRKEEIVSLQEALKILSGEDLAL